MLGPKTHDLGSFVSYLRLTLEMPFLTTSDLLHLERDNWFSCMLYSHYYMQDPRTR